LQSHGRNGKIYIARKDRRCELACRRIETRGYLHKFGDKKTEKRKENARHGGRVARVRSRSPFVRSFVHPSASRTQPSMARSLESTRMRSNRIGSSQQPLAHFPFEDWQTPSNRPTLALPRVQVYEGTNLTVLLGRSLRAPHDVADVLYYRLTKVTWRDSPPGHDDRDVSERASWDEKRKEKKKKRKKDQSKRAKKFNPRALVTLFLSSSL